MSKLKIDYKKELENASKGMIMIHDPNLLIRLMIRTIVRKLGIRHAGVLLYEPERKAYVLTISQGETGIKIPKDYTRFEMDSPLIKIFIDEEYHPLSLRRNAIVIEDINKFIWQESVISNGNGSAVKELLSKVNEHMQMLNAEACVPAYYQKKLMAVLLLGEKLDGSKFEQEELDFFAALASDAAMGIRNAQLFERLSKEAERNHHLFLQTINVLGSTIEAKDAYTHGHTERVTQYSVMVAEQMIENGSACFSKKFLENIYIAGLLHDIGKIGVPGNILNKTGRLTDDEYKRMQYHTIKGEEILKPLNLPQETIDGIKHHHEAYSGKGYPDGLKGEAIPLTAAIIAVADAYDAMTSDRPYRTGMLKEQAIEEIKKCTGTQFVPKPAAALIELYDKGML